MEGCIYYADYADILARTRMFIESSERFYEVYLWDDEIALQKYLDDKKGGKTLGLTCNEPREALRSKNKIGEIHFASGCWNMNIVAHECLHATFNIMRLLGLDYAQVENEERICYFHGELTQGVYRWLSSQE